MSGHLKDKVAIVTGAGHGIGREIALALTAEGAKAVVNDINAERAEETVKAINKLNGESVAFGCSVSEFQATEKLIQTAVGKFGRLDILINNAGISISHMIWNMTEDEWDRCIATNLKGTFNCTRHASALMRQQRSGRIINVTSAAWLGAVGDANYSAAKGGIVSFTRTVALDIGKYGVTCNCFAPIASTGEGGLINEEDFKKAIQQRFNSGLITEMRYKRLTNMPPAASVPPLVVYLCTDSAANINGQVFNIYGNQLSIYSHPAEVKSIIKKNGKWTIDELIETIPTSLLEEYRNQAPAAGD